MKIIMIIMIVFLLFNLILSVNKPDFGKMMNEKREKIKQLREKGISINRTLRYSENYKFYE